jgi:hypothetical protein
LGKLTFEHGDLYVQVEGVFAQQLLALPLDRLLDVRQHGAERVLELTSARDRMRPRVAHRDAFGAVEVDLEELA